MQTRGESIIYFADMIVMSNLSKIHILNVLNRFVSLSSQCERSHKSIQKIFYAWFKIFNFEQAQTIGLLSNVVALLLVADHSKRW